MDDFSVRPAWVTFPVPASQRLNEGVGGVCRRGARRLVWQYSAVEFYSFLLDQWQNVWLGYAWRGNGAPPLNVCSAAQQFFFQ